MIRLSKVFNLRDKYSKHISEVRVNYRGGLLLVELVLENNMEMTWGLYSLILQTLKECLDGLELCFDVISENGKNVLICKGVE